MTDVTLLTCKDYFNPKINPYTQNILDEYHLLKDALESYGLSVDRVNWDSKTYDFSQTRCVVFRTIWDYFERFEEFSLWLQEVSKITQLINPLSLIKWNIDKHYFLDLEVKGIRAIPTVFVDQGNYISLSKIAAEKEWKNLVIKPAISGAAFKTYKVLYSEIPTYESIFKKLVSERDMLIQEYQETITTLGEASLMVFDGKYTHAVVKKAKPGDFRVQDDFGGTVLSYEPTAAEIAFAENVFSVCESMPVYGRVDIIWDEHGTIYLSELEIIEPELWIRNYPKSAMNFAEGILKFLNRKA